MLSFQTNSEEWLKRLRRQVRKKASKPRNMFIRKVTEILEQFSIVSRYYMVLQVKNSLNRVWFDFFGTKI